MTRLNNTILSSIRKRLDPVQEGIINDCGHAYVMGKIREELSAIKDADADTAATHYERIATLAINGAALCIKKKP